MRTFWYSPTHLNYRDGRKYFNICWYLVIISGILLSCVYCLYLFTRQSARRLALKRKCQKCQVWSLCSVLYIKFTPWYFSCLGWQSNFNTGCWELVICYKHCWTADNIVVVGKEKLIITVSVDIQDNQECPLSIILALWEIIIFFSIEGRQWLSDIWKIRWIQSLILDCWNMYWDFLYISIIHKNPSKIFIYKLKTTVVLSQQKW